MPLASRPTHVGEARAGEGEAAAPPSRPHPRLSATEAGVSASVVGVRPRCVCCGAEERGLSRPLSRPLSRIHTTASINTGLCSGAQPRVRSHAALRPTRIAASAACHGACHGACHSACHGTCHGTCHSAFRGARCLPTRIAANGACHGACRGCCLPASAACHSRRHVTDARARVRDGRD